MYSYVHYKYIRLEKLIILSQTLSNPEKKSSIQCIMCKLSSKPTSIIYLILI